MVYGPNFVLHLVLEASKDRGSHNGNVLQGLPRIRRHFLNVQLLQIRRSEKPAKTRGDTCCPDLDSGASI